MNTERFPTYSPSEREMAIKLLSMGHSGLTSREMWEVLIGVIKRECGRINYREIEIICRENNISMSLLAIPAKTITDTDIRKMVVDPNNPTLTCPFFALICETPADVPYYAQYYGVNDFDPRTNLERLSQAGTVVTRPDCKPERIAKASLN